MDGRDDATRCARIAAAVVGYGKLTEAAADLHRLPADLPARGLLAAGLVEAMMRGDPLADPRHLRDLDRLLVIADTGPPSAPRWRAVRAAARALALMRAAAERELADPEAAVAEVDRLAPDAASDPAMRAMVDVARMGLRYARAFEEGDDGAIARFPAEMARFVDDVAPGHPQARTLKDLVAAAASAMAAHQRGDDVAAALARMRGLAEQLPPGNHLRTVMAEADSAYAVVSGMADEGDGAVTDDRLAELARSAARPGLSDADRAVQYSQVGAAALRMGMETDPGRVDTGVTYLRRAVEVGGPDDPQRVFHLTGLALALYRRGELTNARADLREARSVLLAARTLAGGPAHPQWPMINGMLSDIRQLLGDGPDFHRDALDGQRGYVWKVLLQPGLADAASAVRSAAGDAVDIARQSLIAGDPAGAISALDGGRGLALFAATGVRTVADRLADAGESELAQRWRTAAASGDPAKLPTDLRRAVLRVLATHPSAPALLEPPDFGEIQRALATVDADALVYLVPGNAGTPGYAIAAPVVGGPGYLALPNLRVAEDLDVERYLAALARRDRAAAAAGPTAPATPRDMSAGGEDEELAGSLDALCDWAWRAAVGPLIEKYLPRLPVSASGRPYRVVLVPMGDLARIPWQAARRSDGTYAVQLIGISQAASARMLCFSAALAPVPLSPVGLVVGDPDTNRPHLDLTAARLEAYAVRQVFYRGARYVGRRPDGSASPSGAGTGDEVRDWLTASGMAAGAMLHLACHGFVDAGPGNPTAYLLLAGGERLTAEELVNLMAKAPERDVGLVVLAACRTGLAMNGYDEAYSLGTAFLAGGVRSVLCTQWSIPDNATSVLMYMFHHYLRVDGRPVWAALRAAQLWMLDPHRVVPDRMPGPLRAQLTSAGLDAVVAWAAFTHWGR